MPASFITQIDRKSIYSYRVHVNMDIYALAYIKYQYKLSKFEDAFKATPAITFRKNTSLRQIMGANTIQPKTLKVKVKSKRLTKM